MSAGWVVVVPVKTAAARKTRLTGVPDRVALGRTFALDAVAAAAAARGVLAVVVVTDADGTGWPGATAVLRQRTAGLNGAILDGVAAGARPGAGTAVLLGDLPALTATTLAAVLDAAMAHPLGVVPDAAGTGSALITARAGERLVPRFGAGSAARHVAAGHVVLAADDRVRRDVDTAADLADAVRLGVGPATAALLAASGEPAA